MERQRYPTDLTEAQWNKIAHLFPQPQTHGRTGRPRLIPVREILNALFYQAKAGGGWRMLPHDLPKWQTVYYYLRVWTLTGQLQQVHDTLREQVRIQEGRESTPSAAIRGIGQEARYNWAGAFVSATGSVVPRLRCRAAAVGVMSGAVNMSPSGITIHSAAFLISDTQNRCWVR